MPFYSQQGANGQWVHYWSHIAEPKVLAPADAATRPGQTVALQEMRVLLPPDAVLHSVSERPKGVVLPNLHPPQAEAPCSCAMTSVPVSASNAGWGWGTWLVLGLTLTRAGIWWSETQYRAKLYEHSQALARIERRLGTGGR